MFFFGNIRAGKVKVVTVVTGSLPKGFALSSRIFQNPPTPELISAFCPRLHLMSHLRLRPTIGRQAIHALQCLWFWLKHGPIMSHIYIYTCYPYIILFHVLLAIMGIRYLQLFGQTTYVLHGVTLPSESERTFTVLQHRSLWGAGNESEPFSAVPRIGRVKGSAAQLHCGPEEISQSLRFQEIPR
jgi:hypothetical protein